MLKEYTPIYPRSVSGKKYRLPLNHPQIEAIAARADAVYRGTLTDHERGTLLKLYRHLKHTGRSIYRREGEKSLPKTEVRPKSLNVKASDLVGCGPWEIEAGFIWRISEYVERLERKYGADTPVSEPDEI